MAPLPPSSMAPLPPSSIVPLPIFPHPMAPPPPPPPIVPVDFITKSHELRKDLNALWNDPLAQVRGNYLILTTVQAALLAEDGFPPYTCDGYEYKVSLLGLAGLASYWTHQENHFMQHLAKTLLSRLQSVAPKSNETPYQYHVKRLVGMINQEIVHCEYGKQTRGILKELIPTQSKNRCQLRINGGHSWEVDLNMFHLINGSVKVELANTVVHGDMKAEDEAQGWTKLSL
ncbi:uncharacterized protein K460DRAFT_203035 [Cucurbitaria berberidis CBS 394.84]|uniref:Uncharacterized protein n=1 Tax=Cucurbitaria berberidis CBS 394.84 TaxID=1168544 RepID=A0A9P4G722_9PLEO|nr:uncharacterized protein K460DRAFT_203035 [Cucurbitaria berberidis CBS 394.84]KAF1840116.1 hypothetical protein K460DRAFT_203035 [Cucurbitaria berberidis CBS 394.84]